MTRESPPLAPQNQEAQPKEQPANNSNKATSHSSSSTPDIASQPANGDDITPLPNRTSQLPVPDSLPKNPNPTSSSSEMSLDQEKSGLEAGEEKVVEDEEGKPATTSKSKKKRKRGAQETFTDEQIAFLESRIPTYEALGDGKKAKTEFWLDFLPEFFERFPEAAERKPSVRKRGDPNNVEDDSVETMEADEQRALQKRVKRYNREDAELSRDSIKNKFHYLRTKHNRTQSSPFEAPLKKVQKSNGPAPHRTGLPQFVAGCPEYKDQVVELSEETGPSDRLHCRVSAAQKVIATFTEEELERAHELMEEQYQKRLEEHICVKMPEGETSLDVEKEYEKIKCRRALAGIVEPFLHFIREHTGMAVFFQAGLELDHPDRGRAFDVFSMCSVPEGSPKFADYDMNFFQLHFGKTFAEWLRVIKRRQIEAGVEFPEFIDSAEEGGRQVTSAKASETVAENAGERSSKKAGKKRAVSGSGTGCRETGKGPKSGSQRTQKTATPSPGSIPSTSSAHAAPPTTSLSSYLSTSSTESLMTTAPPMPEHTPGMSYEELRSSRIEWQRSLFKHLGLDNASQYVFGTASVATSKTPLRGDNDDYAMSSDDDEGFDEHEVDNEPVRRRYATRASTSASHNKAKAASPPTPEATSPSTPEAPSPPTPEAPSPSTPDHRSPQVSVRSSPTAQTPSVAGPPTKPPACAGEDVEMVEGDEEVEKGDVEQEGVRGKADAMVDECDEDDVAQDPIPGKPLSKIGMAVLDKSANANPAAMPMKAGRDGALNCSEKAKKTTLLPPKPTVLIDKSSRKPPQLLAPSGMSRLD